jgi:hypothetical protein
MFGGDGIGIKNLELALARKTEVALDGGIATGGTNTTVDDATKGWTVNQWVTGLSVIQIIKPSGVEYFRAITANTATQITFAALPGGVVAVAGDLYSVRIIGGGTTDITDRWARQLGQVDLARVLGAALAHGNPIIVRVTDGAAFISPATEATLAKILPIAKAAIFNQALPAAEASWLGADIAPTNSPSFLRVHLTVAAAGILRVARTVGGVTVVENLNAGNALTLNAAYIFDVEWRTGDTINFRYSVTGANILVFRADEVGAAA